MVEEAKQQSSNYDSALLQAQARVAELERTNGELARKLERGVTSLDKSMAEVAALDVDGLQSRMHGQARLLDETAIALRHLRDKVVLPACQIPAIFHCIDFVHSALHPWSVPA